MFPKLPHDVSQRLFAKARRGQGLPSAAGVTFMRPCLLWRGAVDNTGYGVFHAFPGCMGLKGNLVRVHRLAFWYTYGPFPQAIQIDHLCRERTCFEPQHLQRLGIIEHARKSNADKAMDKAIESALEDWEPIL